MKKDYLYPLRVIHGKLHEYKADFIINYKLKKYRNKFRGEKCFVIGNGPSLSEYDLDILSKNKEITFATNRIYLMFNKTNWRPTFYVCEDQNILRGHQKEINNITAKDKFVPRELNTKHNLYIDNALYFHMNYDKCNKLGFGSDIRKQIDCRGTVTCTCIHIAMYMGFSSIYLLGVDHNYYKTIDINGIETIDASAKDYFCEGYDKDIQHFVIHDLGESTRGYLEAKAFCDTSTTTKIYNATRGGKLEIFERVDFDSLFI